MMSTTQTGTVRFFNERGYGFIIPDAGQGDVFVHADAVVGIYEPTSGDKVTFEVGTGRDGRPRAKQVRIVSQ
jgi:CspA family cold shock protein